MSKITFHIYRLVSWLKVNIRLPNEEEKTCSLLSTVKKTENKKIVHMNNTCFNWDIYCIFHEKFYFTVLQNLVFHLTHVRIPGTHNCGKQYCDDFQHRGSDKGLKCHRNYDNLQ